MKPCVKKWLSFSLGLFAMASAQLSAPNTVQAKRYTVDGGSIEYKYKGTIRRAPSCSPYYDPNCTTIGGEPLILDQETSKTYPNGYSQGEQRRSVITPQGAQEYERLETGGYGKKPVLPGMNGDCPVGYGLFIHNNGTLICLPN